MPVAAGQRRRAGRRRAVQPRLQAIFGCQVATDPRRAAIGELLSAAPGNNPITVTSDPGLRFRVVDALADWWGSSRWPGRW
jgi:hypothetical protein